MTTAQVHHQGGYPLNTTFALIVGKGNSIKLRGETNLTLSVLMQYQIIEHPREEGMYKIRTTAYFYTIGDAKGKELVAYHWHPEATPTITFPHLHVNEPKLKKGHFPTRRVALEQVLRTLIRDFKIKPKKDDWETILDETQQAFEDNQSWR